ncbi:ABC transporter family substrate-binding protein, partial [Mycolicibacterium elephantis]
MKTRRFAAATLATVLVLSGCSGGNDEAPSAGGAAEVGTTNDINPQPRENLREGGNLRLALNDFPPNFNSLHIDGNTGDVAALMRPTMPRAFRIAADGSATVNTDYFTSVELTSTDPQVVTYTINPEAVWSDGTPITWEDLRSQIEATSGKNDQFGIAATNGSDRVASVERGVDDRQAVITFAEPWADWKGMFAGSTVLTPKSTTANPEAFNQGQLEQPGPSAGPFMISELDRGAKRITLTRNPKWWGEPPLLDRITFLVLDDAARIPALQNNTIDASGLATLDEMEIARRTADISIRRAPGLAWYHFTFNGAPGKILEDPALRRAIAKGIDRNTIAAVTMRGLADNPVPLNNHIFVAGQEGYQDNSGVVAFNPDQARQELDALGWRLNGQFREKDGRQLVIRDVLFDSLSTRQYGQIAQNNLAQIGVKLELDVRPAAGFFTDFITVGNFDIAQFAWSGDAFPLASLTQIYRTGAESNFGRISSPEIDA